ncbi:MAG TPA: hypothetical protein V6D22_24465 [Candidatus Obscuribacterales bacterium]
MIATQKTLQKTAPKAPQGRRGITRRIFASGAIWLVFWLALFDVSLGLMKPLRHVDVQNYIFEDQDPMDDKARELLSPFSHYNVLLIGSSLLAATAGVDFTEEKQVKTSTEWNFYTKAHALDHRLSSNLHVNSESFNMGIAACMIQEDKLILQKALESGHQPAVLMLFLAPRDFIDNSHKADAHVVKYFAQRQPFWTKLSWRASTQENFDRVITGLSSLYRSRGHYMKVIELAACNAMHRAPNLFYAQQGEKYWREFSPPQIIAPLSVFKHNRPKVLPREDAAKKMSKYYEVAYWPINHKRYQEEMTALAQLLELAKQNHILPLVVNMPRGLANESMLPEEFRSQYMADLARTCANDQVKYVNFEGSQAFDATDFSDGVHLSPTGGAKFLDLLTSQLAEDKGFDKQLHTALDRR